MNRSHSDQRRHIRDIRVKVVRIHEGLHRLRPGEMTNKVRSDDLNDDDMIVPFVQSRLLLLELWGIYLPRAVITTTRTLWEGGVRFLFTIWDHIRRAEGLVWHAEVSYVWEH